MIADATVGRAVKVMLAANTVAWADGQIKLAEALARAAAAALDGDVLLEDYDER